MSTSLFEPSLLSIFIFVSVALLVGMAKTGVHGAGMLVVPMLATLTDGHSSAGLLLPLLSIADIFGVTYYHRHASWPHLKKLFPWAALGVVLGAEVGARIDDGTFKLIMAIIVIGSLLIMTWLERGHKKDVPDYTWFAILMGVMGGFTSMVGNLAGSVMALYLLSMHLPKNVYIGTTAWFFLVLNLFKIPFHIFRWKTISWESFLVDVYMIPVIALGAWFGILIVKRIPETAYRWFIITMTLIAAIYMLIRN